MSITTSKIITNINKSYIDEPQINGVPVLTTNPGSLYTSSYKQTILKITPVLYSIISIIWMNKKGYQ